MIVIEGHERGRCIELDEGTSISVGRDSSCQFQLRDPSVSRVHCHVSLCGHGLVVVDANSRWGTFVNSRRIAHEQVLQTGDRVLVGETEFLVTEIEGDSQTVAPRSHKDCNTRTSRPNAVVRSDHLDSDKSVLALSGEEYLSYQIHSTIASARTGVIFRAYCPQQEKDVALKIFWPRLLASENELARFVRAMETAVPIRHENIVSVYSAGRHRGVCYSASEIVEGESVAQLIGRIGVCGMLDWRRVLRIAIDVTQALIAADEHGVVHRNITPHNLLIRTQDDVVKLNDLVLAKAIARTHTQQITQPDELLGDLAYMSPEHLSAEHPVDQRSDIYSLGAALYTMLTARPPLEGRNTRETIDLIQLERPKPPSAYHLSISPLFEGEVLRMLEKRPEDRHSSPQTLLHELHRVARYENVPA